MRINDPEVLQEVTAQFERYQSALIANQVEVLDELFWDNPLTLRYGATECLYGIEEIRAFRNARPTAGLARTVIRTVVTTYGRDSATTNIEFMRPGMKFPGRQSQTWVRMQEGWKIVSAHVSNMSG